MEPILSTRQKILIAVVAVLAIVAVSVWFYSYSSDAFAGWASTFLGTVIGASLAASVGLWLFRYQEDTRKAERVEELCESLIAELQATRDRLQTNPEQEVPDPIGNGPTVKVVMAHIEPLVCEEVIRSALFGHVNTNRLTYLSRLMREYTSRGELLRTLIDRPVMSDPHLQDRIYTQAKNVKGQQQSVVHFCDTILEGFKAQGLYIPLENKYYSDPARKAPDHFVKYDQ